MAILKANANPHASLPEGFEVPEGLAAVAVFDEYSDANDAGLAVLAMGEAYWMFYAESAYVMCVHEARAEVVRAELEAFWSLQAPRQPVFGEWPLLRVSWRSFSLYLATLIVIFLGQGRMGLVEMGRMDSVRLVESWQIWRSFTALSLHADVVHLVSNLVAGIGFVLLVCRLYGAGLGWLLVLLGGALGNLLTGVIYYPDSHLAIGASTAVFAALGVLTGSGVWMTFSARQIQLTLPHWILPLIGGFVLLGMLGVGEGPVDVLGHISGFLCGGALGLAASALRSKLVQWQRGASSLVVVLLLLSWSCALYFDAAQSALP